MVSPRNATRVHKHFLPQQLGKLPTSQKFQHSRTECQSCPSFFPALTRAFPGRKRALSERNTVDITIAKPDLSLPPTKLAKKIGHDIVTQLEPTCKELTGRSLADVLQRTPTAGVTKRKTPAAIKKENREQLRGVKHAIESELHKRDHDLLFQNRLSFRKYNSIRLAEAFETSEKAAERTRSKSRPSHRIHGTSPENVPFDKDALVDEAKTWSDDQQVNWTQLAGRYGVTGSNRGQKVKEFLETQEIPAAMIKRQVVRRAKLRLPGREITYPTHKTVTAQKKTLLQKIEEGDILIGELIVPISFTKFVVDKSTKGITETVITLHGRQISLDEIRSKLLREHMELGVTRFSNQCYDAVLSDDDLNKSLDVRRIGFDSSASLTTKKELLQTCTQQRYLKVWHDHGPIAGRGHFMVLISCLYDPAFYYTPKELADRGINVDVISVVEKPQIHILAQSGSSDAEQMVYNDTRTECLCVLDTPVNTAMGVPITDTLRYFHGDGPAQEFEIGHNRGGHYPCIACHTHVSRFDDLCHAYRNPTITLKDHQQFMLDGKAWQRGGARPFAGLNKLELQTELQVRVRNHTLIRPLSAPSIDTMDKTELQVEFNRVKKGFCNFPALATSNPNAGLGDLHIAQYEVAPTEPLHDFKGHMANSVAEVRANTQGVIHEEVEKIYKATLKKDTVRGVDYRKATILFSNTFDRVCPKSDLHCILHTAVQISEVLYARETTRCQKAILRFHNLCFQHAAQCVDTFHTPTSITKQKMFGRYFHSLSVHAPVLYRQVALRSLNTELQERLFNTCNDITKTTSNRQANSILNNIIIRV